MLEYELPHEPILSRVRLLLLEDLVDLPQVDHRVHRLEPVGGLQGRELAVRAEHRLEFFGCLRAISQSRANETFTNS